MYSVSNQSGHTKYNVSEFICDSIEDIEILPLDCAPGSTAIVVPNDN